MKRARLSLASAAAKRATLARSIIVCVHAREAISRANKSNPDRIVKRASGERSHRFEIVEESVDDAGLNFAIDHIGPVFASG
jgi:hypothetical protein